MCLHFSGAQIGSLAELLSNALSWPQWLVTWLLPRIQQCISACKFAGFSSGFIEIPAWLLAHIIHSLARSLSKLRTEGIMSCH